MPQLRQNVILKEWVIISTERAKRPDQLKEKPVFIREGLPEKDKDCPFCPGSAEYKNIIPLTEDCGDVVVVPNKFPALSAGDGDVSVKTVNHNRWMHGIGNHEVLIESPQHNLTIATMKYSQVENILKAYRDRIRQLTQLPYVESVIPFRNHGTKAGASLVHPHSQIIGLPIIPHDIMSRINESIRHYEEYRECIFCRVLREELSCGDRIIMENDDFVAFTPYAAGSPFHTWIYPRNHHSNFDEITPGELSNLARILRDILRKLYIGLNDPDYNFIVRSAPKGYQNSRFFHWYITIVPRLTRTAGFELGSGMFINPSIPEENAEYLRSVEV